MEQRTAQRMATDLGTLLVGLAVLGLAAVGYWALPGPSGMDTTLCLQACEAELGPLTAGSRACLERCVGDAALRHCVMPWTHTRPRRHPWRSGGGQVNRGISGRRGSAPPRSRARERSQPEGRDAPYALPHRPSQQRPQYAHPALQAQPSLGSGRL